MKPVLLGVFTFLVGISWTFAKPQEKLAGVVENTVPLSYSATSDSNKPQENPGTSVNLLDALKWKDMLAKGKVREMIDTIQRALGTNNKIRARTQWGGPEHPNLGNAVRNTVNWNAYQSDKKSFNIIMDTKVNKEDGKVDVVDPSLGFTFQMKY